MRPKNSELYTFPNSFTVPYTGCRKNHLFFFSQLGRVSPRCKCVLLAAARINAQGTSLIQEECLDHCHTSEENARSRSASSSSCRSTRPTLRPSQAGRRCSFTSRVRRSRF